MKSKLRFHFQMDNRVTLTALLLLIIAGVTYINYEVSKQLISAADPNQLDCGFGKDFDKFLSSSDSIFYITYNTKATTLKERT